MLEQRERGETDFLLVDVREPAEREIVAIDGSVLIPKNEFLLGDALQSLPQDKPVVIYCKVGGRSAEVLAVVKGAGFANAQHVGGGVVAWVNQIEPEQAHVLSRPPTLSAAFIMSAMTLRIDCLTIDCSDPQLLADFWSEALGWRRVFADDVRDRHRCAR